jgi:hypothetical protein
MRPYLKSKLKAKGLGYASSGRVLALSSIPSTTKKKKKKRVR